MADKDPWYIYQDISQINDNKNVQLLNENFVDVSLEAGWYVE